MADLRSELTTMRSQLGSVSARTGVKAVEEHPDLYPRFHARIEWDDSVAGPKYREIQFAEIVREIKVHYASDDGEVRNTRAFVAVETRDDPSEKEYVPTEEVAEDPRLRALALRDAEREWRSLFRKYEHLQEFVRMVREDVTETVTA